MAPLAAVAGQRGSSQVFNIDRVSNKVSFSPDSYFSRFAFMTPGAERALKTQCAKIISPFAEKFNEGLRKAMEVRQESLPQALTSINREEVFDSLPRGINYTPYVGGVLLSHGTDMERVVEGEMDKLTPVTPENIRRTFQGLGFEIPDKSLTDHELLQLNALLVDNEDLMDDLAGAVEHVLGRNITIRIEIGDSDRLKFVKDQTRAKGLVFYVPRKHLSDITSNQKLFMPFLSQKAADKLAEQRDLSDEEEYLLEVLQEYNII